MTYLSATSTYAPHAEITTQAGRKVWAIDIRNVTVFIKFVIKSMRLRLEIALKRIDCFSSATVSAQSYLA
jgi:hypothetical protein